MNTKELIARLEELDENVNLRCFDQFGNMYTSTFDVDSWRGAYDMPAIVVYPIKNWEDCTKPAEAIKNLKECDGLEVCGYKGGDYILSDESTVYLVGDYSTAGDGVSIKSIFNDGCMNLVSKY